jgi:Tol biopolymer transport system component
VPIQLHGRIAFSSDAGGNVDIYVMEVPGMQLHRLTTSTGFDFSPTWSPDGSRLAFRSDRDGNDEVYVMNSDGSGQRDLTNNSASDYSPAWSPDGSLIAFASSRDDAAGNNVWTMSADGSAPQALTHERGINEYPQWSPDGSRVAFNCSRGRVLSSGVGDFEICVVNADGRGLSHITDAPGVSETAGWSPNGTMIMFSSNRDQDPTSVSACGDLFTVGADGSHVVKLTTGPAVDCGGSWARDGHMLFSSDRGHPGGNSDLYVMNPDGSDLTRLTQLVDSEQDPVFLPTSSSHTPYRIRTDGLRLERAVSWATRRTGREPRMISDLIGRGHPQRV